jgi:hypothetical protein
MQNTYDCIVRVIVWALGLYLFAGALFAIPFAFFVVNQLDPAAKHAGAGFRLTIIPGVIALWPSMFSKWLRVRGERS